MNRRHGVVLIAVLAVCCTAAAFAQFGGQRGRYRDFQGADGRVQRNGVPDWKLDEKFENDVFTFVRIRYRSHGPLGLADRLSGCRSELLVSTSATDFDPYRSRRRDHGTDGSHDFSTIHLSI